MFEEIDATVLDFEKEIKCSLMFERANICPRCGKGIQPIELSAVVYSPVINGKRIFLATVFNFCTACQDCFIAKYTAKNEKSYNKEDEFVVSTIQMIKSEPIETFKKRDFSSYLNNLSPQFVKIYNQSEQAEQNGLDQILGIGYRKSLEFLIKDYVIHLKPSEKSKIETIPLSKCIHDYIENKKIQELAEKSAWLGNDETHYIKKHTDRDVSDLKKFINACANYIEMELTVEDASTIEKL